MAKSKKQTRTTQEPAARDEDISIESLTKAVGNLSMGQSIMVSQHGIPKLSKKNIAREFDRYFGDDGKLANWQRLCQDIGLNNDGLTSVTKCRKELRGVWINIFDFLASQRQGKFPRRFRTEKELSKYTIDSGKVYPKKKAKEGGPVRVLLAHVFRHDNV